MSGSLSGLAAWCSEPNLWLVVGFAGQALFFSRFLVQWVVSEKKKESVIPAGFWYLSLGGGILLLMYAVRKRDPVFIVGQSTGLFVYLRNIMLSSQRLKRHSLGRVLLAAGVLAVGGLYAWEASRRGFFEGSEGRYAEIAREMFVSGDWLVPRYYDFAHLDKPPLTYWLTAAGYGLFGLNEWGSRFFLILASLLAVLMTARLARSLYGERAGWAAGAVLATSPLWWMMGQALTTDMFLAAAVTGAYAAFFRAWRPGGGAAGDAVLFWVCLGLSFLAKGPVGLMVVALPIAAWAWLEQRELRGSVPGRLRLWPWGVLVFCAVALPWYLAMMVRDHGVARFWLVDHVLGRLFRKGMFHRPAPFYYFVPVILAGFLPWVLWLVQGLKRAWEDSRSESRLLVLWVGLPFAVFSLSASKLPSYVLPLLPAMAIVVGRHWDVLLDGADGHRSSLIGLLALAVPWLGAFAGFLVLGPSRLSADDFASLKPVVLAMGGVVAASLAAWWASRRLGSAPGGFIALAGALCGLLLCGQEGAARLGEGTACIKGLGRSLAAIRLPGEPVVAYRTRTDGIPLYSGIVPIIWKDSFADILLESDRRKISLETVRDWGDLCGPLRPSCSATVVTQRKFLPELSGEPVSVRVLAESGKFLILGVTDRSGKGSPPSSAASPDPVSRAGGRRVASRGARMIPGSP